MAGGLLAALVLAGCQSLPAPSLTSAPTDLNAGLAAAVRVLADPDGSEQQRLQAEANYRDLLAGHLPELLRAAAQPSLGTTPSLGPAPIPTGKDQPGVYTPADFAELTPVVRSQVSLPGLHRFGLGLPMVGRIDRGGPNAPPSGFQIPLTLVALPSVALPGEAGAPCCRVALVDPQRILGVGTDRGDLRVAMDLDAPIQATRVTGPRLGSGLLNLLRPGGFGGDPRIVFLQPFDPDKTPLVLVHGLLSTPRMWTPLVMELLADEAIRARYQIWFFYYPTGQPVPLSALQLREALDAAVAAHGPVKPMVLVGHSMGGILSRAQVSRIGSAEAETLLPGVGALPADNLVRRALIFEPRPDVSRAVFQFTPHRGSWLATHSLGSWGVRLIRLPDTLISELGAALDQIGGGAELRLPTSIQGLSPDSAFLRALDQTRPVVPTHTILGDRGRGDLANSSDGVVPFTSAHLDSAESEVVVPTGHGGFTHPDAVVELKRILKLEPVGASKPAARKARVRK